MNWLNGDGDDLFGDSLLGNIASWVVAFLIAMGVCGGLLYLVMFILSIYT